MPSHLFTRRLPTPLGPMIAMVEDRGLVLLEFDDRPILSAEVKELCSRHGYRVATGEHPHLDHIQEMIAAYFLGTLRDFTIPCVTPGTGFQNCVWGALRSIPYGGVETYGSIARKIGHPTASRAVGHANGQNRIAIVIPCHRVIGSDGSLTGYGAGEQRKAFLLDLERSQSQFSKQRVGAPGPTIQSSLFSI